MYYSIICYDIPNSSKKRNNLRQSHIKYLNNFKNLILFAGPIMNEKEDVLGSLIVVKFSNRKDVDDFSKNDPYFLGGLFEKVLINKFKKVF
ncbi:YciI family protein [Rickettsiales bacterium]|nr:YciI family protein [Rickettsiales bacterium]